MMLRWPRFGLLCLPWILAPLASCSTAPEEKSPSELLAENSSVVEELKSYNVEERSRGIAKFKKLGRDQGSALIMYILDDPKLEDYRLEVVMARILADWKDTRAIPHLLESLQVPDDGAARIAAEGLLAFGENPRVVDALEEMLKGESVRDRVIAAETLGKINTERTTGLLGARYKEELDGEVRARLAIGILQGRHPRRRDFLIDALMDSDQAIRELAWNALTKYRDVQGVDYAPGAPPEARARAVGALRARLQGKRD